MPAIGLGGVELEQILQRLVAGPGPESVTATRSSSANRSV
jgi:hypothetical protein